MKKLCNLTIIGERINSTRKSIARAIETGDEAFIRNEARLQYEAGADFVDVNAGAFIGKEAHFLPWLVRTAQSAIDLPLSLDSTDPEALRAALEEHRGPALINSITLEQPRLETLAPLAREYDAKVIALAVDSLEVPADAQRKCETALRLVEALNRRGIRTEDIYIDPIIQPVSASSGAGLETLGAMRNIRALLPDAHILCGLRNISFHLPQRHLLDRAYLAMAMAAGADTAIIDPCDAAIMATIAAAELLLGKDAYCRRYLHAYRDGRLNG
jgi:5-methyltetrahydrofolate--homocysteine methyltransferase